MCYAQEYFHRVNVFWLSCSQYQVHMLHDILGGCTLLEKTGEGLLFYSSANRVVVVSRYSGWRVRLDNNEYVAISPVR